MHIRSIWLAALASMMALMSACSSDADGPNRTNEPSIPSNAAVVEIAANSSVAPWVQAATAKLNGQLKTASGKPVYTRVTAAEAGDVVARMSAESLRPTLWIPDDASWPALAEQRGISNYAGDCASTATSPLVLAMWRPLATLLGWPGRSIGWLDISSLTADPSLWAYYSGGEYGKTLRIGHGHPGVTGSGASTLLAVAQAVRSQTAPVTANDISDPLVQASLASFEGGVSSFGLSTGDVSSVMAERGASRMGAAVMYESDVLALALANQDVVPVYPFEGTFVATHPACIDSGANAEAREAAKLLRDALLRDDMQTLAVERGLRPVNRAIQLGAPLTASFGVDLSEPKRVFEPSTAQAVDAMQNVWKSARKPVHVVMLIDTSGSMRDEGKIDVVRTAAAEFVRNMGNADRLTLVTFASAASVQFENAPVGEQRADLMSAVESLRATGNTALFDAIQVAGDEVAKANSAQRSNIMVVLTDGRDTSSQRVFGPSLMSAATANDTSVYTIAYGSDADNALLEKIANDGNGKFFQGSVANIASIYQEMTVAFGGSAGIGR